MTLGAFEEGAALGDVAEGTAAIGEAGTMAMEFNGRERLKPVGRKLQASLV